MDPPHHQIAKKKNLKEKEAQCSAQVLLFSSVIFYVCHLVCLLLDFIIIIFLSNPGEGHLSQAGL